MEISLQEFEKKNAPERVNSSLFLLIPFKYPSNNLQINCFVHYNNKKK